MPQDRQDCTYCTQVTNVIFLLRSPNLLLETPDYVDANKTMRVCFAKDGDRVVLTETFGKDCIVTRMRMDEEITYAPGDVYRLC